MQNDFNTRLAARLKDLRQSRDWSLDDLAQQCGLSRATLSRLEKGEVSPTAEGLGRLCSTYGLTMSRLMMMVEETFEQKVAIAQQPVWTDPETAFRRQVVSPKAPGLNGEVLRCSLPPSSQIRYESPPRPGQEHHLVMLDGILMLTLGNASYELRAGDCLRYQLTTSSLFETGPQNGADYHLFLI